MVPKQNDISSENSQRTLIAARFSAIGDVAMVIPALYSLCVNYRDIRVVFVTRSRLAEMFINRPDNLTVLGVDVDKQYSGIWGLRRLARKLVSEYRATDYVDLHAVLRTQVLGFWLRTLGVKTTSIHKDRKGRRALTRAHNKVMMPLVSARAMYRRAFADAGFEVTPAFYSLFGESGKKADAATFAEITKPHEDGEKWLGIAPFAAHRGKIYPPELMRQVLDGVIGCDGVKVFLFGGGGEEQKALAVWADAYPGKVISLAGKRLGFAKELALMSHLDLMVSMDSANMHLAALTATPVVSIWGATHAFAGFGGWRQGVDDRVELSLGCRPCSVYGKLKCRRGDYMCMTAINPETIINKIASRLHINPRQK